MSEELKPCPFCGGEAEIRPVTMPDGNVRQYVSCLNDSCGAASGLFGMDCYAVDAWNRRAERTCHDVGSRWSIGFRCDVCGFDAGIDDDESVNFGTDEFNYCPNCGRRVVYDDTD